MGNTNRESGPGHPASTPGRALAHMAIRFYQLTFSAMAGRQCRHAPSCSEYTDMAIQRHGVWAGGWMGLARISRCRPWGTAGYDPVLPEPPPQARWYLPWRYGAWRRIPGESDAMRLPCKGHR